MKSTFCIYGLSTHLLYCFRSLFCSKPSLIGDLFRSFYSTSLKCSIMLQYSIVYFIVSFSVCSFPSSSFYFLLLVYMPYVQYVQFSISFVSSPLYFLKFPASKILNFVPEILFIIPPYFYLNNPPFKFYYFSCIYLASVFYVPFSTAQFE